MFELLSAPIRKYVREQGWQELRSIQAAAIKHIIQSEKNIILSSKTASGKTEAAFLPILSKASFKTPGVKVLYISPLIALINDQFVRVEHLCSYLDVPVTKWHGEAKRSQKDALIRNPEGIVLITPESLEAMFTNRPEHVRHLFSTLEYVIIDEIHSFIGTDRGVQLQSLLYRLLQLHQSHFRLVGLSATIGELLEVKKFTGNADNTTILRDPSAKDMQATLKFFESGASELPLELIKDVYLNVKDKKALIFPNSRGRAEEVAVKLKKISDRVNGHPYYFSHHSSIDKELREYIEKFAKNNIRSPFAIACTSTLELGIDIGTVELVIQIDAAHSIASLVQRVGRSGRKDGMTSDLLFYATDQWSLLQSLACLELYKSGFIEPALLQQQPFDIIVHQALSIIKQFSGIKFPKLANHILNNPAFSGISQEDIKAVIGHLLDKGIVEQVSEELIIGMDGERLVNTKDFYSVFKTDPVFKVVHQEKPIGELPLLSVLQQDDNILLAARIWKIIEIDQKAKKIYVAPAKDGKKPIFFGSGGDVHERIRQKMLEILVGQQEFEELDDKATEILRQMRRQFNGYTVLDLQHDRPVEQKQSDLIFYTFQGTKVNRSLHFLFKQIASEVIYNENSSSFSVSMTRADFHHLLQNAADLLSQADVMLAEAIQNNPELIAFSKWAHLLPTSYQKQVLKMKQFDFQGAKSFLAQLKLVYSGLQG